MGSAIADYTEAIRLDPKDPSIFLDRAGAYESKGELERAIGDYSESIRLNPGDPAARCSRGGVYRRRSEWDRAIADYTETIRLCAEKPPAGTRSPGRVHQRHPIPALWTAHAYRDRGDVYLEQGRERSS